MGFFKKIIERLTWRKKICPECKYFYYTCTELPPCGYCKRGSEFREYTFNEAIKMIKEEKGNYEMTKQQYHERNIKERERIMLKLDSGDVDKDILNLEYILYSIEMGSDFYRMGCVKSLRKAIDLMKKAKGDKEQNEAYATMEGK